MSMCKLESEIGRGKQEKEKKQRERVGVFGERAG